MGRFKKDLELQLITKENKFFEYLANKLFLDCFLSNFLLLLLPKFNVLSIVH